MKKILFVMLISSVVFASNLQENNNFALVEVETEFQSIYDDGIFRNVYSEFEIKNLNGETILKVGKSFDNPAIIKIISGEYIVSKKINNEIIEKRVTIENKNVRIKI